MNRILTPLLLMPHFLPDPAVTGPRWDSGVPALYRFRHRKNLALTLTELRWIDEFGRRWRVPPGLPTDGTSFPFWVPWSRWDERSLRAAVLHDFRYLMHDFLLNWLDKREDADKDFRSGLQIDWPDKARLFYTFLRLGGEPVWRSVNKDELVEQWLIFVDKPDQRVAWMDGLIAQDKAA